MNGKTPAKWLRCLMYIHIVSIANSLLLWLSVPGQLTMLISRLISAAAILCMLRLSIFNQRYRKAGIFRAVMLACMMLSFFGSVTIGLIASFLAIYQEYRGHSEIIGSMDPKLGQKWRSLFGWSIGASLLVSFGTSLTAVIVLGAEYDTTILERITMGALDMVELAVDGFYLWYLVRTIRLFEPET